MFSVLSIGPGCSPPDPEREKQKRANRLMGQFVEAEIFWIQEEVAHELIERGTPNLIPKLTRYLKIENRRRRCNAAMVLAGLGDEHGIEVLLKELKDTTPRKARGVRPSTRKDEIRQAHVDRAYAAMLLGTLQAGHAVTDLVQATTDTNVQAKAAVSLGQIGDPRAIPALRKMVENFPEKRLPAGYGLAALGETQGF
ncbi:MAG: HEAT repeat domain-containing protein, partial [Verrucomicrobiota bacterium]